MARKIVKYHVEDKKYSDTSEIFDSLFGKALRILLRREKVEEKAQEYEKSGKARKARSQAPRDGVTSKEAGAKPDEGRTTAKGKQGPQVVKLQVPGRPRGVNKSGAPQHPKPAGGKRPRTETQRIYRSPIRYDPSEVLRLKADKGGISGRRAKGRGARRRKKGSNRLRLALALVLVAVLGGELVHTYGLLDFDRLTAPLRSIKKKDLPLVEDVTRIVRSVTSPAQKDARPEAVQKEPANGDSRRPAPARKLPPRVVNPPQPSRAVPKEVSPRVALQVKPRGQRAAPSPEAPPIPRGSSANKPPRTALPSAPPVSYPYSVYLGSYGEIRRAEKAMAEGQKNGLTPYCVKVDLGEKGIWYRVYAGYFRTRDEANAFIKRERLADAKSRYIKYANLIGLYRSRKALEAKRAALEKMGYHPYVIRLDKEEYLLYVGGFYRKAWAEKQGVELASRGLRSRVVER